MKARFFGCGRFGWLASEGQDRPLTIAEHEFMRRHREVCPRCVRREEASALALNMLRQAGLEASEEYPRFERRIVRRVRLASIRASFRYWSPAVYGATIAAVALIAALQLLARSSELPVLRATGADAHRIQLDSPMFPSVPIANQILSAE